MSTVTYYKDYTSSDHVELEPNAVIAVKEACQYYAMDETSEVVEDEEPSRFYYDHYLVEITVEQARELRPNLVKYLEEEGETNV